MKQVLFKLKRRVVLFKETAQMILNQAEFSEVKPWLDLLSAEMGTDFAAEWKLQILPPNSEQIWLTVRHFLKKEILRIGSALQVMCKENRPQDIRDEDVFIFAELCSELGHLAVYLQSPEVDEKLTDVAEGWISLLVPPRGRVRFSKEALSILFASIMEFKGMGCVELQKHNYNPLN